MCTNLKPPLPFSHSGSPHYAQFKQHRQDLPSPFHIVGLIIMHHSGNTDRNFPSPFTEWVSSLCTVQATQVGPPLPLSHRRSPRYEQFRQHRQDFTIETNFHHMKREKVKIAPRDMKDK